ncbi:hypothetical protein AB5I41_17565 [Sphingomonas sp. MMS24-JH45]
MRGDMKAVIRAILLDEEARSDAALTNPAAGRLREPVLRLTAWARAFDVRSPSEKWAIGDTGGRRRASASRSAAARRSSTSSPATCPRQRRRARRHGRARVPDHQRAERPSPTSISCRS